MSGICLYSSECFCLTVWFSTCITAKSASNGCVVHPLNHSPRGCLRMSREHPIALSTDMANYYHTTVLSHLVPALSFKTWHKWFTRCLIWLKEGVVNNIWDDSMQEKLRLTSYALSNSPVLSLWPLNKTHMLYLKSFVYHLWKCQAFKLDIWWSH